MKSMADKVAKKAYKTLEDIISQKNSIKNSGCLASEVACLAIYKARKLLLKSAVVWPHQLVVITRQT